MAELGPGGYLHDLPIWARQGMVDVKAAWRVLDPARGDRPERYLHRPIYTGDGVQLMGLVAPASVSRGRSRPPRRCRSTSTA